MQIKADFEGLRNSNFLKTLDLGLYVLSSILCLLEACWRRKWRLFAMPLVRKQDAVHRVYWVTFKAVFMAVAKIHFFDTKEKFLQFPDFTSLNLPSKSFFFI